VTEACESAAAARAGCASSRSSASSACSQPPPQVIALPPRAYGLPLSRPYARLETLAGRGARRFETEALQCSTSRLATASGVYVCPIPSSFPLRPIGRERSPPRSPSPFALAYPAFSQPVHVQGLSCRTREPAAHRPSSAASNKHYLAARGGARPRAREASDGESGWGAVKRLRPFVPSPHPGSHLRAAPSSSVSCAPGQLPRSRSFQRSDRLPLRYVIRATITTSQLSDDYTRANTAARQSAGVVTRACDRVRLELAERDCSLSRRLPAYKITIFLWRCNDAPARGSSSACLCASTRLRQSSCTHHRQCTCRASRERARHSHNRCARRPRRREHSWWFA